MYRGTYTAAWIVARQLYADQVAGEGEEMIKYQIIQPYKRLKAVERSYEALYYTSNSFIGTGWGHWNYAGFYIPGNPVPSLYLILLGIPFATDVNTSLSSTTT